MKFGSAFEFAERLSEMRKPPLAAPRAVRGGGIFEENDGGDMLQDSERSEICDVRIPSVSCADSSPCAQGEPLFNHPPAALPVRFEGHLQF